MEFPEWNCHDWLASAKHFPAIARAHMHPSQPAARARMHPTAVQYSGWWVPAGIPTASARVQMGGEGGCQYAGNSDLSLLKGVTRGKD